MKRIPRRIFVAGLGPQEEFKREAIKLVNVQGLSIAEAIWIYPDFTDTFMM